MATKQQTANENQIVVPTILPQSNPMVHVESGGA